MATITGGEPQSEHRKNEYFPTVKREFSELSEAIKRGLEPRANPEKMLTFVKVRSRYIKRLLTHRRTLSETRSRSRAYNYTLKHTPLLKRIYMRVLKV